LGIDDSSVGTGIRWFTSSTIKAMASLDSVSSAAADQISFGIKSAVVGVLNPPDEQSVRGWALGKPKFLHLVSPFSAILPST
jgi:hypothetical protein